MTPRRFSKGEAIRFGWEITKKNFWLLFLMVVIVIVVGNLSRFLGIGQRSGELSGLGIIIVCLQFIVSLFLSVGMVRILLKLTNNEPASLADLFSGTIPQVVSYFVALIISAVLISVGLILLIIPAVIVALRLSQVPFLIVDKNRGPVDAVKQSWAMTQGSVWNLFLFALLTILLEFVGTLALLIGLFFAIPTILVAAAFIYRKLSAAEPPTPTPAPAPA